jgi:hypothetical protein
MTRPAVPRTLGASSGTGYFVGRTWTVVNRRIGELWLALGCLHFLVVATLGWSEVSSIVSDGYVNAVGEDPNRNAAFWLFYLGVPFVLIGLVIRWAQRQVGHLPESLGWASLVAFGVGMLAVPASGFGLGVLLALYMLVVSRRSPRPVPQANY